MTIGAVLPQIQVQNLPAALNAKIATTAFSVNDSILTKNDVGVIAGVPIKANSIVARDKTGSIVGIEIPDNSVVARSGGAFSAVTFSTLLSTIGGVDASALALSTGKIYIGDVAGKASEALPSTLSLSVFGAPTANLNMGAFNISTTATPAGANDLVTKGYVDTAIAGGLVASNLSLSLDKIYVGNASGKAEERATGTVPLNAFGALNATMVIGNFTFTTNQTVFGAKDLVTKQYVIDAIGGGIPPSSLPLATGKVFVGNVSGKAEEQSTSTIALSAFGPPTANIALGAFTFNTTLTTFGANDLVTKTFVQSEIAGATISPSNISLNSGQLFVGSGANKAVSTPKDAINLSGFGLANNNIVVGNVSNVATSKALNAISLSDFAAPTADLNIGTFGITTTQTIFTNNHFITKQWAVTNLPGPATRITNERASLVNGSMTLITLAQTPAYPSKMEVRLNSVDLEFTVDYTVTGKVVTATSALNVALGGTGVNGLGFNASDTLFVSYDPA